MSWTHVRWAVTGMAIGLLIALAPSCGKKCGPDNCPTGCCSTKNECVGGTDSAACGSNGAACNSCSESEACKSGACMHADGGGGGTDGGEDGGVDAGTVDAGQSCTKDDDCAKFKNGSMCNTMTGQCVAGKGCNVSSDCDSTSQLDPCYRYGLQCRCVTETGAPQGFGGVCRRRLAPCEECTDDAQCGNEGLFDPKGICKVLQGGTKKFCFQQKVAMCPCGMEDDHEGYCKPQNNDCSAVGCNMDKSCPSGSICNVGRCLCEPRCRWDFSKKELAAPGCPPGKTCWVDNANLDPKSLYYGAGRCRPPCTTASECAMSASNAFGGPKLTCAAENLEGGGQSAKRCRANGDCMDDAECPEQPLSAIPLGYCDRGALTCNTDCRPGNDPVTGTPFKDCRAPYACSTDGGAVDGGANNFCRLLTCVEQGGAAIACTRGEYCCGEDKNQDGVADPCPPPSERKPDNCYSAPKPPFCTECMSDDDCKNVQLPSYLAGAGACANGSKSPSCSPLPTMCMNVGPRPGTMMPNVAVCAPSTFNDGTKDSFGVGRDIRGCPAGYPAVIIRPKIAMGDDYCSSDSDCNQGTDAGSCKPEQALTLKDGGHPKTCQCVFGATDSQCPNNDAGLSSECRFGISGQTLPCVQSVVCLPNSDVIFSDAGAPRYGCGL
jgi:hypothetical protein